MIINKIVAFPLIYGCHHYAFLASYSNQVAHYYDEACITIITLGAIGKKAGTPFTGPISSSLVEHLGVGPNDDIICQFV